MRGSLISGVIGAITPCSEIVPSSTFSTATAQGMLGGESVVRTGEDSAKVGNEPDQSSHGAVALRVAVLD